LSIFSVSFICAGVSLLHFLVAFFSVVNFLRGCPFFLRLFATCLVRFSFSVSLAVFCASFRRVGVRFWSFFCRFFSVVNFFGCVNFSFVVNFEKLAFRGTFLQISVGFSAL